MSINYLAGIDEAGRGPVIGPLVIAVAAIDDKHENELKKIGVKDSKLLSEKQREEILEKMMKLIRFKYVIIQPEEIDEAVLSKTYNLNWLEADKGAEILNDLNKESNNMIKKVILDCPSTNLFAYTSHFQEHVKDKAMKIISEHKADFHYPIVGAASIIAKVTREKELEKLKKKYKIDFGSGYPSDPKTKEFIEKHFDNLTYGHIFRKSWATFKNASEKSKQRSLGEF